MNPNETLMEQIRRLNAEEQVKHELRKQAALNKIKRLREQAKEKIKDGINLPQ